MRKISLVLSLAIVALSACTTSFKKGDDGLEYKITSSGSGEKVQYGQYMQLEIAQLYNDGKKDSLISDTRTAPQGPAFEVLDSANMPPAYFKILSQLKKGDSLTLRILVDSAFAKSPQGIPDFFKKGNYLITTAKVVDVFKTREAIDIKQKALAAEVLKKDDKTITEYLAKEKIQATKGALGTYVQIITPGTGTAVDTSVIVKTFYTGVVLGSTKAFDSNQDPFFNRTEPLLVNMTSDPALGVTVITGWSDGLKLLSKGAKAKFYIPSSLAYGAQGAGQDIKPNSILVFDIEVADVLTKEQAQVEQKAAQAKMEAMQKKYMDSVSKAQPQPTEAPKQ
jgi:FKBP-type peptidyl-prolyl cis-trans isomerase